MTPRRGSSWPLLVETDAGTFFTKLTGAGHGPTALVAEVIVAELAERLGLRVPRRVLVSLDSTAERDDRDPELAQLLDASLGLNLGFETLDGTRDFRPEYAARVSTDEASIVAWLDWLVANADRTWRSPNLLVRRGVLWLIDHGAALPFHHDWSAVTEETPRRCLVDLSTHALRARASALVAWDPLLAADLDRETLRSAVGAVPDAFLRPLVPATAQATGLARRREAYVAFLWKRLRPPRPLPLETLAA
jgi:HipA-like kinase